MKIIDIQDSIDQKEQEAIRKQIDDYHRRKQAIKSKYQYELLELFLELTNCRIEDICIVNREVPSEVGVTSITYWGFKKDYLNNKKL